MKKYTLNIGLNDKDTKRQEISTAAAVDLISKAAAAVFPGITVYAGKGIYKHENGVIVYENTLIVDVITDNESGIHDLISYAKKALNQESILLQVTDINIMFI